MNKSMTDLLRWPMAGLDILRFWHFTLPIPNTTTVNSPTGYIAGCRLMQHFGPRKVKIDHTSQSKQDVWYWKIVPWSIVECWTRLFAWSEDLAASSRFSRRMQSVQALQGVVSGMWRAVSWRYIHYYLHTYIRTIRTILSWDRLTGLSIQVDRSSNQSISYRGS